MPRGSKYGQRQASRFGIKISDTAVSDNTATTIANVGDLVIDIIDGKLHIVDADTKTQEVTS